MSVMAKSASLEPERFPISLAILRQRHWLTWAAASGFWFLFGILSATQTYWGFRNEGLDILPWWRVTLWQGPGWFIWGLITPPIVWLAHRYRIERSSWLRGALFHLGFAVTFSAARVAIILLIMRRWNLFPRPDPRPFHLQYLGSLLQWIHLDILIYGAIVGAVYAVDYYRKFRERDLRASQLEAQLAQAQLQALRMQLQPHFLFNTLNGIASLIRNDENKPAIKMIAGLSDLLRHALENSGKQEVSLREEIELLEKYLKIQQMRFSDRLRVRFDVRPEALQALIPNLLLQPIVENTMRHGIAHLDSPGLVELSAWRENGALRVMVYNDGPELPVDWRLENQTGIGLANTRARLEQLYGDNYRFDLYNRTGGGVEATFTIPFRIE